MRLKTLLRLLAAGGAPMTRTQMRLLRDVRLTGFGIAYVSEEPDDLAPYKPRHVARRLPR